MRSWLRKLFARKTTPVVRTARLEIEALEDRCVPTVTYHGGALLPHVEVQAVYLGSDWTHTSNLPQTRTLDGFLKSLVGGTYMDSLSVAGYAVWRGTASSGVIAPYQINHNLVLTDAGIQRDLQAAISGRLAKPPDANRLYVVFVEPNVAVRAADGSVSRTDFLGYHAAFTGRNAAGSTVDIRYAVIPYPGGTAKNASIGNAPAIAGLTEVASHEIAEAVTDPDVDHTVIAWYDDSADGEIADLTNLEWTALNGFAVQRIADKHGHPMTPAGATALQPVSFVLTMGGRLYEHTAQGWVSLCGGVASVSNQGVDNSGKAMVDVVLTNGLAYEFHDGTGWTFLSSGVKDARAGQGGSYVLLRNGDLCEFRDTDAALGATLAHSVASMDAGTDRYGVNSVAVVFNTGKLSMFSDATGWHTLCGNVKAVSAGYLGVSAVLLTNGRAYQYREAGGTWTYLGSNIAQVSAGFDAGGHALLDLLTRSGSVAECHVGFVPQTIITGIKAIGEARGGVLDVVYLNGSAYERTAAGWRPLTTAAKVAV